MKKYLLFLVMVLLVVSFSTAKPPKDTDQICEKVDATIAELNAQLDYYTELYETYCIDHSPSYQKLCRQIQRKIDTINAKLDELYAYKYENCPFCGDGIVNQDTEQCDDGNNDNNDGCNSLCVVEFCGDGTQQSGEQCDDGNINNGDGCNAVCEDEFCGDGTLQTGLGEACDDGGSCTGDNDVSCKSDDDCSIVGGTCTTRSGDGCSSTCQVESSPYCGDFFQDPGEECDNGKHCGDAGETICFSDITCIGIGDELCKPRSGDGCSNTCIFEPDVCGNLVCEVEFNETKANCPEDCGFPFCGDGVVNPPGEECDDGNTVNTDACTNACTNAVCGDGITGPGEQCDNGEQCSDGTICFFDFNCTGIGDGQCSPRDGDGCSSNCTFEPGVCGNLVCEVEFNETQFTCPKDCGT